VLDEITPTELRQELDAPEPPMLVDVRTHEERSWASIEPSLHIGLDEFLARVGDEVPRDADVVVYCHVGGRSAQAVMWMAANGWARVRNLSHRRLERRRRSVGPALLTAAGWRRTATLGTTKV
jgi:adenylyltransferase/sulfurtransferase